MWAHTREGDRLSGEGVQQQELVALSPASQECAAESVACNACHLVGQRQHVQLKENTQCQQRVILHANSQ